MSDIPTRNTGEDIHTSPGGTRYEVHSEQYLNLLLPAADHELPDLGFHVHLAVSRCAVLPVDLADRPDLRHPFPGPGA